MIRFRISKSMKAYLEGSEQFPPLGGGGSLEYRSNTAVHSTTNPFPDIAGIAWDGMFHKHRLYQVVGWMLISH